MTRDQLEAVIRRQLRESERVFFDNPDACRCDLAVRTILAAIDDWAAAQMAAAVTPPEAAAWGSATPTLLRRIGEIIKGWLR